MANNVQLVMVSIGKPEVGKDLVAHLGLRDGENYLFVDPDNEIYDDLDLNRGIKETFFSPSTPLSFLDRFASKGGMNELTEVMSKWNKAFYIPPKQSQAFNQGGTFVFSGPKTLFAHYDESTGAHAKVSDVVRLAVASATNSAVVA